jgi:hypothetical protein
MKDTTRDTAWRSVLKQGDPLHGEQTPEPGDVARMRTTIVAAIPAGEQGLRNFAPAWALALACMFVFMVSWGVSRVDDPVPVSPTVDNQTQQEEPRQRKLEFSTPGGTRVVWTLASDFDV